MSYHPSASGGGERSAGGALTAAILMTLCCNQICGIIAIVFSVVAMGKDDWAERDRFIGHAWTTMTIGLVISLVFLVIYFLAFAGG